MTDWVRLWHDMPTDPKWRVVARKSGQPLACVIAVFNLLMVSASQNADERGTLQGWDDEDAAAALDMDGEAVTAILLAMQGKVLDGNRLTGWEKRQPKREDGNAAERKAAWKAREEAKRNASERIGTHGNAPETDADAETEVPLANANVAPPPPASDEKRFWDTAKAHVGGKNPGSLIGKWRRDFGPEATRAAVTASQVESSSDPPAYIEKILRRTKAKADAACSFDGPC